MTEDADFLGDDKIFGHPKDSSKITNRRIAVRYVRRDIKAEISVKKFLTTQRRPVKLLDISSKGALISCSIRLSKKQKLKISLKFKDGKTFRLNAVVVYTTSLEPTKYGIKFDRLNNDLGEQLFTSQTDLIFK